MSIITTVCQAISSEGHRHNRDGPKRPQTKLALTTNMLAWKPSHTDQNVWCVYHRLKKLATTRYKLPRKGGVKLRDDLNLSYTARYVQPRKSPRRPLDQKRPTIKAINVPCDEKLPSHPLTITALAANTHTITALYGYHERYQAWDTFPTNCLSFEADFC